MVKVPCPTERLPQSHRACVFRTNWENTSPQKFRNHSPGLRHPRDAGLEQPLQKGLRPNFILSMRVLLPTDFSSSSQLSVQSYGKGYLTLLGALSYFLISCSLSNKRFFSLRGEESSFAVRNLICDKVLVLWGWGTVRTF